MTTHSLALEDLASLMPESQFYFKLNLLVEKLKKPCQQGILEK